MRTSGTTVVFSGMTVIVSLAGLFLIDSTVMRSMAIGAIVVVVDRDPRRRHAAAGADRAARPARRRARPDRERHRRARAQGDAPQDGRRARRAAGRVLGTLDERVMRRPALSAILAAGYPAGARDPRAVAAASATARCAQFPEDYETRVGAELASQQVAAGRARRRRSIVADFGKGAASDPANKAALARYAAGLKQTPGVAQVGAPVTSQDGHAALLNVVLAQDPESEHDARPSSAPARRGRPRLRPGQGGGRQHRRRRPRRPATSPTSSPAGLWKVFAFVMICSYLVLLVVLRSVLLPLKAVLMNVLSVAAAYGVLVVVFQYGWLDGISGYNSLGYVKRDHAAAAAGDRLRPVDGLRGLPALAHQRALPGHRRQPPGRRARACRPAPR